MLPEPTLNHYLMLSARNAGADRPVVECRQPQTGHVLQRLDTVNQSAQEQALHQAVVILEPPDPLGDLGVRLGTLPIHFQVDLMLLL